MSMKSEYEKYLKDQQRINEKPSGRFFLNQENRYVKPFRIFGNLYYVGDSWVCVHLIDTGDGLLLLDAGNCGAEAMLIHCIWEMGFHPADVKWIILSHGHVDHFGAASFFKRMFGTKIYMGAPDVRMFHESPHLSMIQECGSCMASLVDIDVQIQDGDRCRFGNTEMLFYLVPGHTEGCIACFFDVTDGNSIKHAGFYGGFGFNTLQKEFLLEIGDCKFEMRKAYLNSLKKVRNEKVELFVGNHTANVELLEKSRYMSEHPSENPFLDEKAWSIYLDRKEKELKELE